MMLHSPLPLPLTLVSSFLSDMEPQTITKEDLLKHARDDKANFDAINATLSTLATKEDVKQIIEVFNNLKTAGQIIAGGSKWGYRILITIAAIVFATATITGGFKAILVGLLGWIMPKS